MEKFQELPNDAQLAVFRELEGLLLFLSTMLLPYEQTLLHMFVYQVLGPATDVRVADYLEGSDGQSCRLRLVGSDPADLMRFAEQLARAAWHDADGGAGTGTHALLLGPNANHALDFIRERLERQEVWWRDSGVREMLEDQAERHNSAKDIALLKTWGQEHLPVLGKAAVKRLTGLSSGVLDDFGKAAVKDATGPDNDD